ncbi:MAG: tetratricopeptide repeat protein, partial [bacterium]|nr:tetratricopeptide repeat protein [bacterium]
MKCWNIKVSNFKIMRSIGIALLVLVFTGAADGFLYGQAGRGRGRLKGIITNKDGQYIENARIQIVWHKNQEFKRETVTNKKGRFTFNGLSGGNWQIFVIADGYAQVQKMASIKQVADNPTVKITLKKQMAAVKQEIMKDDGSSILDKGKQLFAQAKYEEAQEAFEKFLQKQPNVYQTYLLLGNCYKEKAEYKEARAQYDKALENAPKDGSDTEFTAQVQAGIGDIYMRQNDLKTAQEYFQKSLDLNPKDHILAYNVGEIF